MSDTPKWYVTEYPEECSFAVTDGYDIFAMISGGKTVGDECDLANRIAKLPDLERERDKWEETARLYCQNSDFHREMSEKAERERDEAREIAGRLAHFLERPAYSVDEAIARMEALNSYKQLAPL